LRQPLLADDMPAWLHAWKTLDATILKDIVTQLDTGEPLLLTLCGERHARTWGRPTTQSIGQRILKLVRTCLPASKVDVPAVLKDL
ncbi:MAG: hypothetical protein KGI52_14135, partial [Burkholderiales bacterium]|nr:hypothetical protein [Burkholderiales bacterium]